MATMSERPVKVLLRRPKAIPLPPASQSQTATFPLGNLSAPGNTPTHSARSRRHVNTALRIGKILRSDASEELKQKRLFAEILFGARDGDMRYMLSNQTRSQTVATSASTMTRTSYSMGGSLVHPRRTRGPAPLPTRAPIRACLQMQNLLQLLDEDDQRYVQPPLFTLNDFLLTISDVTSIPLANIERAVFSRRNYKKIVEEVQAALFPPAATADGLPHHVDLSLHPFDESSNYDVSESSAFQFSSSARSPRHHSSVGVGPPRLPARQLVTEVAALMKEQVQRELGIRVECAVKYLPKYVWRPEAASESDDDLPIVEIIITEQGSGEKLANYPLKPKDLKDYVQPGHDMLIHSISDSRFKASVQPHAAQEAASIDDVSPMEMAVLDCLFSGGQVLSFKALFLDELPEISILAPSLTYLNVSFNNLSYLSVDLLAVMPNLRVLKARDNPLYALPEQVDRLANLSILVLSHCLLRTLPFGLFRLQKLEHLDISYNEISFVPGDIEFLQRLKELNVAGNELRYLPCGMLRLESLRRLAIRDNYMHPLLWKEEELAPRIIQKLSDLSLLQLYKECSRGTVELSSLPENIQSSITQPERCECCGGARFGPGVLALRTTARVCGVRGVPLLMRACEPRCLRRFLRTFHAALSGLPPEPSALSSSAPGSAAPTAVPTSRMKSSRGDSSGTARKRGSAGTDTGNKQVVAAGERVSFAETPPSNPEDHADDAGALSSPNGNLKGSSDEDNKDRIEQT